MTINLSRYGSGSALYRWCDDLAEGRAYSCMFSEK